MNFIVFGCISLSTFLFLYLSKDKYYNILAKIAYQSVLYYSYVEINVKKQIKLIYNFPIVKDSIYKIHIYMFNEVELIKSNFVFKTCSLKDVVTYNPDYIDFFIYTDHYTSNKVVSKNVTLPLNIEKCDYRFYIINVTLNNVELIDDETTFIIQFDQYYMVNNIINKYLICFLIYRQFKVYLDPEMVTYKIELMDNNMNYKSLTEKEEIVLKKETYLINKKEGELFFDTNDKISNNINFIDNEDWDSPLE
jgi:hypothetical protein